MFPGATRRKEPITGILIGPLKGSAPKGLAMNAGTRDEAAAELVVADLDGLERNVNAEGAADKGRATLLVAAARISAAAAILRGAT